ncbi:ATP-binding protein [Vibrio halioticoli]|nr:ATP-binding protein [Vibrio halioticoli]
MVQYCVLCIEDCPYSLSMLQLAFKPFERKFTLLFAKDVQQAQQHIEYIKQNKAEIALVMASQSLHHDSSQLLPEIGRNYPNCRKILTCDPNQLQSLVVAINEGRLDHCFTYPLQAENTHSVIKNELTEFIISQSKIDWLPYGSVLDSQKIMRAHIEKRIHAYRSDFIRDYHSISDDELSEKVCAELDRFFTKHNKDNTIRYYSSSHLLTEEGSPNQYLWFILDGKVALYKQDEHGKRREVALHGKGGIIGGMSFVSGEQSFSTALTLSPTKVIKLSKTTFTKVMHSNSSLLPLFTNLLLRHFNRRLQGSIHTKLQLEHTFESLKAAQSQLVENEKMVVLGQLVAGVAHELNNPISAILRSSDTLIHEITRDTEYFNPSSKRLSKSVLQRALVSNPLPTAVLRQKSSAITHLVESKQQAKMVIMMGLESEIEKLSHDPQLSTILTELEHYYTAGTTLRSINVCSSRIADMVKSLKSYARSDEESIKKVDIHEGIEDTLVIFENRLKSIDVERNYHNIGPTLCQPNALQQVWTNLVSNALDAMGSDGKLIIHSRLIDDVIEVIVEDNGQGIDPLQLEHIFELNFTTKKQGDFGLGIGLSVCNQIIHQHQGSISVKSEIGKGTQMIVRLPFTP